MEGGLCEREALEGDLCLLEFVSLPSGDAHANVAGDTDSVTYMMMVRAHSVATAFECNFHL